MKSMSFICPQRLFHKFSGLEINACAGTCLVCVTQSASYHSFFTFMATKMATPPYTTHYIVGRILVVHQCELANKSRADFKILKLARDLPGFTTTQ